MPLRLKRGNVVVNCDSTNSVKVPSSQRVAEAGSLMCDPFMKVNLCSFLTLLFVPLKTWTWTLISVLFSLQENLLFCCCQAPGCKDQAVHLSLFTSPWMTPLPTFRWIVETSMKQLTESEAPHFLSTVLRPILHPPFLVIFQYILHMFSALWPCLAALTVPNNSSQKLAYKASPLPPALQSSPQRCPFVIYIIYRARYRINSSWQAAAAFLLISMASYKLCL